jgi:hypothetical protein
MTILSSANKNCDAIMGNAFVSMSATANMLVTKWRNDDAAKDSPAQAKYKYIVAELAYGAIIVGGALEALVRLVSSVAFVPLALLAACFFDDKGCVMTVLGGLAGATLGGGLVSAGTVIDALCSMKNNIFNKEIRLGWTKTADWLDVFKGLT